jgi:hypothetical protein
MDHWQQPNYPASREEIRNYLTTAFATKDQAHIAHAFSIVEKGMPRAAQIQPGAGKHLWPSRLGGLVVAVLTCVALNNVTSITFWPSFGIGLIGYFVTAFVIGASYEHRAHKIRMAIMNYAMRG